MVDLAAWQKALGISFNDLPLLEQALVHRSYINENPALAATSNERMEFLGDAILGLVIAESLYHRLPYLDEGGMTKLRSSLVRRDTLAHIAATVGLGHHLYLGKGEEASGGRHKPTNLAAALEAVIAAVYLDRGMADTRGFILRLFDASLEKAISEGAGADHKSQLQELSQAKWHMIPVYHLVEAVGLAHDKTFTVEVRLGDTVLGKGAGKSKKVAEAEAARSALQRAFTP